MNRTAIYTSLKNSDCILGTGSEKSLAKLLKVSFVLFSCLGMSAILFANDDTTELDNITVNGSPLNGPPNIGAHIPYNSDPPNHGNGISSGGGSTPPEPPEPPDCNTGDDDVDKTGDFREQLMEQSLQDDDLPLEFAALFWPDGFGGYDMLEYGVDIPGGGSGPCAVVSPPFSAFPPPDQWPDGVVFYTQPYSHGDFAAACNRTYRAGPSGADRDHLSWLRNNFNDSVQGMVMDKNIIFRFGENASEDEQPTQRCK